MTGKVFIKSGLQIAGAITLAIAALASPAAAEENRKPANTWQGPYIGVHAGGGFGIIDGIGGLANVIASDDMNGFAGGVLAGWNNKLDKWVFSLEADASLGNIKGGVERLGSFINFQIAFIGVNVTEEIEWSASLRARVGYLVSPKVLAFAAGGLAAASYNIKTDGFFVGNDRQVFVGWTIGGGVEASLADNWKARFEYLYTDYGTRSMFNSINGVDISPKTQTARVALITNF